MVTEVEPIPRAKFQILNLIRTATGKGDMYPFQCPIEAACGSNSPTLREQLVIHYFPNARREKQKKKGKGRSNPKSCNVMSTSSKVVNFDIILYTDSNEKGEEDIIYSTETEVPMVAAIYQEILTIKTMAIQ